MEKDDNGKKQDYWHSRGFDELKSRAVLMPRMRNRFPLDLGILPKLTIVANIKAKADKIDLVKTELEKLIPITRAEEGCINYDLHRDNGNPAHFLFYENWKSRDLWQAQMGNQHLREYMAATVGAVEEFTLNGEAAFAEFEVWALMNKPK